MEVHVCVVVWLYSLITFDANNNLMSELYSMCVCVYLGCDVYMCVCVCIYIYMYIRIYV